VTFEDQWHCITTVREHGVPHLREGSNLVVQAGRLGQIVDFQAVIVQPISQLQIFTPVGDKCFIEAVGIEQRLTWDRRVARDETFEGDGTRLVACHAATVDVTGHGVDANVGRKTDIPHGDGARMLPMKCCMGSQESCTNGHVAIQENDGFTAGVPQSFISRSRSSLVLLKVDEREWPTTAESGQVICIVVGRSIVDDDDLNGQLGDVVCEASQCLLEQPRCAMTWNDDGEIHQRSQAGVEFDQTL